MMRNVRKIYVGIVTYRIYKTKKKECTCTTLFETGKTKKTKKVKIKKYFCPVFQQTMCVKLDVR